MTEILLTLGQVADHFGIQAWKVNRVYNRGLLPEPRRVAKYRVVTDADLPALKEALEKAGDLPVK